LARLLANAFCTSEKGSSAPFFVLISSIAHAESSGMFGFSSTVSNAYINCASSSLSHTYLVENGSCDFYRRNSASKCPEIASAQSKPYWKCADATLYCNISGMTTYKSECLVSSTPFCNASTQFTNLTTGRCDPIVTCTKPQDRNPTTNQCVNTAECVLPEYYVYATNSCAVDDQCPNTALIGDTPQANGLCECSSGEVEVHHLSLSNPYSQCQPSNECNAQRSDYMGTFNGLPRCSGEHYCNNGEVPGYVDSTNDGINNPVLVCMSENPCDYETLALVGSEGCSNPEKDKDGDGDLDGGDEGIGTGSEGIAPTATTEPEKQTEQLTKSLVEQSQTNEKLDTLNNIASDIKEDTFSISETLTGIADLFDVTGASTDTEGQVTSTLDSASTDQINALSTYTGDDIGSVTGLGVTVVTKLGFVTGSASCESLSIPIPGTGQAFGFNCQYLALMKNIAGFLMYLLTIYSIIHIALRK